MDGRKVYSFAKGAMEESCLRVLDPEGTVAKKDLVDSLFTLEDTVSVKALEIYIVRLRKKIENSGAKIITLRGLGYMLTYVAE